MPSYSLDIFNVVGDSGPAQFFSPLAVAVPAQINGMDGIAMLSEVIEKVHVPTPGSVHHSMYEEERCWMLGPDRVPGCDI